MTEAYLAIFKRSLTNAHVLWLKCLKLTLVLGTRASASQMVQKLRALRKGGVTLYSAPRFIIL